MSSILTWDFAPSGDNLYLLGDGYTHVLARINVATLDSFIHYPGKDNHTPIVFYGDNLKSIEEAKALILDFYSQLGIK